MANETIDKIIADLRGVEQIITSFKQNAKVPDIERDIVLSKLRTIYEFTQFLEIEKPESLLKKKTESLTIVDDYLSKVNDTPVKTHEDIIEIELLAEVSAEIPVPKLEHPVLAPKDVPKPKPPELPVPGTSEPAFPKPSEIPVQKPQEVPPADKPVDIQAHGASRKMETTTILAEKFQQNKSFLHDALSKYQNHSDFIHKYQTKPINDIFTAISLNEKYLYIKELFNNDPAHYKNTIEKLNSFDDFSQAIAFLDQHFKWDFNDFQVQKIIELVHRRYLSAND